MRWYYYSVPFCVWNSQETLMSSSLKVAYFHSFQWFSFPLPVSTGPSGDDLHPEIGQELWLCMSHLSLLSLDLSFFFMDPMISCSVWNELKIHFLGQLWRAEYARAHAWLRDPSCHSLPLPCFSRRRGYRKVPPPFHAVLKMPVQLPTHLTCHVWLTPASTLL
jgi:hypothetical protein